MKKAVIIAAILLVVFVKGNHAQQYHAHADEIQDAGGDTPLEAVSAQGNAASADQQRTAAQKAKNYLKRAFGPEYVAAWVLVIVAGFGLWATFRTLGILREQTSAAKGAADAALLNAQAVIKSERAWIEAELVKKTIVGATRYEIRAENQGKTPARLSYYRLDYGRPQKDGTWSKDTLSEHQLEKLNFFLGSGDHASFMENFDIRRKFANLKNQPDMPYGYVCVTIAYADVIGTEPPEADHTTSLVYHYGIANDALTRLPVHTQYT